MADSMFEQPVIQSTADIPAVFDTVMERYQNCTGEQQYRIACAAACTLSSIVRATSGEDKPWPEILFEAANRLRKTTEGIPRTEREAKAVRFIVGKSLTRPRKHPPEEEGFLADLLQGNIGFKEEA